MKVLMIPTYFGGISWWRFEVPEKALRAAGVEAHCVTAGELETGVKKNKNFFGWLQATMPKYDLVHVGYSAEMEFATSLFRCRDECRVPVVVDIDDDLDAVPTYNSGHKAFFPGSMGHRVAKTFAKYADGVTFSTVPLVQKLGYVNPTTTVVENWIDVDSWDHPTPKERHQDKGIRIMVTGGRGRYGDLQIIKEPLLAVMAKYPHVRLFFLGATPDWVAPLMANKQDATKNRCFYLQPTTNVPLFNQMVRYVSPDIMLSPVQNNDFNRSKSGLKFLEASLAGAAFIGTDWPTYDIAPKGTCLKVSNTYAEWFESICALVEDASLRQQLAEKARTYTLDFCLSEQHITPRLDFYQSIVEGGVRARPSNNGDNLERPTPVHQGGASS